LDLAITIFQSHPSLWQKLHKEKDFCGWFSFFFEYHDDGDFAALLRLCLRKFRQIGKGESLVAIFA